MVDRAGQTAWARRLASAVYDALLASALLIAAGFVYAGLMHVLGAERSTAGMRLVAVGALGAYFIGFWSRQGQTLAMRTWRLRLQTHDGRPLRLWRATARFVLAWLWWLPGLAIVALLPSPSTRIVTLALFGGCLAYAALALILPRRQYLHDLLCGTEIVALPSPVRATR